MRAIKPVFLGLALMLAFALNPLGGTPAALAASFGQIPSPPESGAARQEPEPLESLHLAQTIPGVDAPGVNFGTEEDEEDSVSADQIVCGVAGKEQDCVFVPWQCWSCDFVGRFGQIMDITGKAVYAGTGPVIKTWMMYIFTLWLIIQGGRLMLGGMAGSAQSVFTGIVSRSVIFFFAIALLSQAGAKTWWDWTEEAVLLAGGSAGSEVITAMIGLDKIGLKEEHFNTPGTEKGAKFDRVDISEANGFPAVRYAWEYRLTPISASSLDPMMTMLQRAQFVSQIGIAIGYQQIVGESGAELTSPSTWGKFIIRILMGIFTIILYGISFFSFPFFIMDSFLKVMLLAGFGPLLIAGFLFKPTSGWMGRAIATIATSGIVLMGYSVAYGVSANMLYFVGHMTDLNNPTLLEFMDLMKNGAEQGGVTFGSGIFIWIAFSGLLLLFMTKMMSGLIGSVFGAATNDSMGNMAQGFARNASFGLAHVGLSTAAGMAAAPAIGAVKGVGWGVAHPIQTWRKGAKVANAAGSRVNGIKDAVIGYGSRLLSGNF